MSAELFENKKRGRPKKDKLSKIEKNKKQLKEMTDEVEESKEEKKSVRKSNIARYDFKCSVCGIKVTLEGDHPDFAKRHKCYRHEYLEK